MTLKEALSQRSCSAVLTAGKSQKNSCICSLTNFTRRSTSCTPRPDGTSDSKLLLRGSNKNILNEESSPTATSRNKFTQKEKSTVNPISPCYCSDCATPDDVPKGYIQDLEGQLQSLKKKLNRERNNNQLLRRSVLVAKKVLEKEIGEDGGNFDNLIKKAFSEGWKGRQEIILILRRKLRNLNKTVERMENGTKPLSTRKKFRPKREESPDIIPDERKIYWCLELERQEVLRNVERQKQKIVASRDSMKDALQRLIIRNEELTNEISTLRKKLSTIPVNVDEGLVGRLREVENKIKINLEEKADGRRKLDDLEQQNCRNCRNIAQFREKITLERKNAKDQESMLNSLKTTESNLRLLFEELNKEKCKQTAIMKKKLEDAEKDYSKIVLRLDKTLTSIADSKRLLEKLKTLRKKNKINNFSDTWQSRVFSNNEAKNGIANNQPHSDNGPILEVEEMNDNTADLFKNELFKYQAALEFLENSNLEKLKKFYSVTNKMKEDIVFLLKNRYVLGKLRMDTNVLKNRAKKFRKVVSHPLKQKLVKKKNSSQNLTETLDEGRMQLNILKTESKFLKVLIKRIFASTEDDCELLEMFLKGNKARIIV